MSHPTREQRYTIFRMLQAKCTKKEICIAIGRDRLKHRKRPATGKKEVIPNRVMIDGRPKAINNRERFGDQETDTFVGAENKGTLMNIPMD